MVKYTKLIKMMNKTLYPELKAQSGETDAEL